MRKRKSQYFFQRFFQPRPLSFGRFLLRRRTVVFSSLPKFLALRQTANILGVHPNTLRSWDASGKLRAIRFGSRQDRRYLRDEVEALWTATMIARRSRIRITGRRWLVGSSTRWSGVVAGSLGLLLVAGLLRSSVIAFADTSGSELLTATPATCTGWTEAAQAQQASLGAGATGQQFTANNAAIIRTTDLGVQSGAGVVSAGFDQVNPQLGCANFRFSQTPVGQVQTVRLRVVMATNGQKNSTDTVRISSSVDGQQWTTLTILPVVREDQVPVVVDIPNSASVDLLRQLRIRIEPDFQSDQSSWAAIDVVGLDVVMKKPVASTIIKSDVARKKELDRLTAFSQASYEVTDQPTVTIPKKQTKREFFFRKKVEEWALKKVEMFDADHSKVDITYRTTDETNGDDISSRLYLRMKDRHPGKYQIQVTMTSPSGTTEIIQEDFLWGVVALNFRRASPQPNEREEVAIGILDDTGRTICNADVTVKVTDPFGRTTTYQTKKSTITVNKNCVDKGVTSEPDYHFAFTPTRVGTYHVALKAETEFGPRTSDDNLFVVENQVFDVQRVEYPTRINPYAGYPVRISVTPRRDFSGPVYERVPDDFKISAIRPEGQIQDDPSNPGMKRIYWNVDWKRGETYFLSYKLVTPPISPALFLTGPLSIGGNFLLGADFIEPRQWQIASDSISSVSWDGSSSANWSDPANWSTNAIPQAGDNLVFPAGAANYSNNNDLGENYWFNSITFNDSGYTLSGNTIILGQGQTSTAVILPGITDTVSSGGNTIALPIRLDATRLITVSNSGETLTISGAITGVGGLSKEGSGKLVLSGGNTYGGTTKVNGGVLSAQNNTALGTIVLGTEVVGEAALELQGTIAIGREPLTLRGYGVGSTGALRNVQNNNSFDGQITIAGTTEMASDSGTLTLNGGVTGTFNLNLDGAGDITFAKAPIAISTGLLTKNGAGVVTYNFPNTYTGLTTVNAGSLEYGCDNAILSGGITVNGGTVDINTFSDMVGTVTLGTLLGATGTITGSTGMLSSGTWTVYAGTISAIIAGDGGAMTKSTPGTVTLTRPNQFTGAVTVSVGVLKIQDSAALGTIDGITTISSGASLQIDGSGLSIPEYLTISGIGLLNQGAIFNTTGNNAVTGLVTLAAASAIESATSTTLTFSTGGFTGAFGLTFDCTGDVTVSGPINTSTGTLIKNGPGTLTLSAYNSFTGATTVNYGTLTLNSAGSISTSASVDVRSGSLLKLDNTSTVADRIGDASAVTMNGGDIEFYGNTSTSTIATAGALTMASGQNTISVFAAAGGSTILRFASLTRTAGATGLFRGTSLGATPAANVATILFTTAPTLTGDDGAPGTPTVSVIQGIFGDNSTSGTGTDMVTYGLGNKNGVRLLNGAGFSNEYTTDYLVTNANVKVTTGTAAVTTQINSLILGSGASITNPGSAQTITFKSGNILNLQASGSIAGANTTLAAGSTEFILRTPQNLDISSLITTTGGLSKSGTGTLTFSTSKTYTGLTSINAGTFLYGTNDAISSGNLTVNDATVDIATYTDSVGAVIAQGATITGSSGVLSGSSYDFRASTISAIIGGSGTTTISNTNERVDATTTMSRDNTYTGSTSIASGVLKLGGAGGGTNTPLGTTAGSTSITNGAMLDLNGYTLGTSEAINTFRGTGIAGQGAIVNTSASAVTYSGALTIATSARIGADYGKITISGSISGTGLPLTVGGFGNIDITGAISTGASGSVTKDGFGIYTPSNGSSTYTGATTVSAGTLKVGAASVGGTNSPLGTAAGATAVTAGAVLDLNGFSLGIAEPLTNLNGVGGGSGDFATGALTNSSSTSVTFTGTITIATGTLITAPSGAMTLSAITGTNAALTLAGSGGGTVGGVISTGTGTLTKIDSGTWTLSGVNTFTGATSVYQGTIKFGVSDAAGGGPLGTAGTGTTVYSGGVIDMNGFNSSALAEALTINGFGLSNGGALVNNSASGVTYLGAITVGSDTRFTNSGAGALTLSGGGGGAFERRFGGAGNFTVSTAAVSAGSVWKDGAGTLTFSVAQTYTGNTTVIAGSVQDNVLNGISSGNVIVAGGTFDLSSNNADTVGALVLIDGTVATSGGASAILTTTGNTLESGTISGVIAGAVTTTKNTAGTVSITGAVTVSGAMTINAGSVTFSGTNGSATSVTGVTVNLAGTLTLDNTSANNTNRLGDAIVVTMNGGNFNYVGSSSTNASETIGQLAIAAGHNVITETSGSGGTTTLTWANNPGLNRTAGATVLFRGPSFGSTPAANVSTMMFTTAPTLTGASGASGSTTISVIKGAFGDNSTSGTGTDMVTYNVGNTNGLRLLNGPGFSGEYATNSFATNNANVKITSNTAAATQNVNSLVVSGGDVTNPGSAQTITTAGASLAGNVLVTSANNIAGGNTTFALTNANELCVLATAATTISASLGNSTSANSTFSGSGNVTISAANTYTGSTFVNSGTLTEGTANAISTGAVTVVGGTYNLNGNSDSVGVLTLTAGTVASGAGTLTTTGTLATIANANKPSIITGTLAVPTAGAINIADGLVEDDAVFSAVITSASTSLTKSTGTGVAVFGGSNTYTGSTAINTGTIKLGAAGGATNTPLGTTAGSTSVASGAALDLNGYTLGTSEALSINGTGVNTKGVLLNTSSTAVTYNGLLTLAAASTIQSDYGDINIANSGTITGATFGLTLRGAGNGTLSSIVGTTTGTIVKNDMGTWTLSGSSTYTGVTTITLGVLKLGAAGGATNTPLGTTGTGTTIASTAMLDLNGYTLGTAEALTSVSGTGIANAGAITTSSGSTTSFSGAITMAAASRITNFGAGAFTASGAIAGNFALTTVNAPGTITLGTGVWSGTGTLVKEGWGTTILSGQNTMTGAMTVSTGTLQVGATGGATNTPLGTIAGGVTVSAGAVLDMGTFSHGGASTWEPLTLNGSGLKNTGALINSSSSSNSFGAVALGSSARIVNSGSGFINITGAVTGGFNFVVNGTGTVSISGSLTTAGTTITQFGGSLLLAGAASTFTGLTRINGGTLQYNVANAINTGAVTVAGGTLDINGITDSVGAITLMSGSITDSNGTPGALTGTGYTFYGGDVSAILGGTAIAMAKSSGGSLTINKSLTNTGTLTINAGTTQYLASNVLSNSSAVNVAGGTLDIGANSDTVAGVTLTSGSITGSTGVLTGTSYGVQAGSITAILAGAVNLTKTTSGTVTLSGTNTYTGITTISGGTLSVGTIGNGGVAGNLGQATNAAANLVFNTGTGTLAYTGSTASTDRNITSTTAITIQMDITNPSTVLTWSGATTATTAPYTKIGPGTLIISGANLHTGTTTALAGSLKLGASNALTANGLTVTNGTFDLNNTSISLGTVTLTKDGQIVDTGGSTAVLTSSATFALQSGTVSARLGSSVASGISKTTTDRVILSGDNSFTSTSIADSAGTLNLQHNNALGASGTSLTLTVTSGAVLELQNTITIPSTKSLTINGSGVNSGGAIKNYADSNIIQGAVALGSTNARINAYNGTLTINGAMTGATFNILFGGSGNITYGGVIGTTSGTLTKDGTGILTLSNTNTYTGATAISAGAALATNAQSFGTTAGGVTVSSGAAIQLQNNITIGTEALTLNGSGVANDGAIRNITDANTWQGTVLLSTASSLGSDAGTLTISGTITTTGSSAFTKVGAGTVSVASTTLGGDLTISAGTLSAAGDISVAGSWTNSGATFSGGSSTVSFTSNGTATITGDTTFNNFSVTAIGAAKTLQFVSSSTTTITGTWTITGAVGQLVTLTRSGGANWNINPTTASIDYVDVSYSTNQNGGTICATHSQSTNGGNSGWSVTSGAVCGVTVSGNIYTDDGTTALNCSVGGSRTVAIKVNGSGSYTASCSTSDGAFSTTVPVGAAGDVLTLFISGATEKGALVTLAVDNSSNISSLPLRTNRLTLSHESAGPITNSATLGIGRYDKDDDATNLFFTANSNNLSVDASKKLVITTGKTYTPGGTVTTTAASTAGNVDGDVLIQSSAAMDVGSNAVQIGGDFTNSGTYTTSSGQTTTFSATGIGFTVTSGGTTFQNIAFNGASGGWTNSGALAVAGTWTGTTGGFTQANSTTITVTGTAFTLANGFTWTKATSGANLILDHATNLSFADNNSTKQNLGVVQIGASPGTTTLTTDLSADTVTIPTGDTLNTKGYDVTTTSTFDCQGTCTLNLTDTAPSNEGDGTILDVGGNFTMSSSATFTAHSASKVFLNSTSGADTHRTFTTGGKAYNDVELKNAGATNDDITIANSPLDVNGTLTITDGQVRLDTNDPNVTTAGNLSIAAAGTVTKADNGTATWTFDGSGTSTWTDSTGSGGQDLGLVAINGSSKTINLGADAKATKLTIATSQTFGLGSSGYTFTLTGSGQSTSRPFQNSGTLNEGTNSTFKYTGTSAIDIDPETYFHLNLSPSGAGSPTYYTDPGDTANPIDVSGNLTIGDATNAVTVQNGGFSVLTVSGNMTLSTSSTYLAASDVEMYIGGSYTNNGTFTDSGNGVYFTATTPGKTLSGSMTGANAFITLIFSGSGGEWTNNNTIETSSLTMTAGTLLGSQDITVNTALTGTAGIITRSGGTVTVRTSSSQSFGPTTASTTWTFNDLTLGNSHAASGITYTTQNCSSCVVAVAGVLRVGKSGDAAGATTTLTGATTTWNLTGTSASVFVLLASPAGAFTANTSTVNYNGVNGSGNVNVANTTYSGLGCSPGSAEIYDVANSFTVSATLTIGANCTLTIASSQTLTHSGSTLTLNGTINGAGRLTYQSATAFPATGTMSAILRMDATSTAQSITCASGGGRTLGGDVEFYNNSVTSRVITLCGTTSHTLTISGVMTANSPGSGGVTVEGNTYDPTINVTGNFFSGTSGGGSEFISFGSGTWTVSGNVDFTDGFVSNVTGGTFVMNGTGGKTIVGSNRTLYNLTIDPTSADTISLTTSNLIVQNIINIADGDTFHITNVTLSLDVAGCSLNLNTSGTLTSNSGVGAFWYGCSATFPSAGTVSVYWMVFDTSFADLTIPGRPFTGTPTQIWFYNPTVTNRQVTLGTAGGQTLTLGTTFRMYTTSTGNLTLDASTNNPNVTGSSSDLEYVKSSTGSSTIISGSGTWTFGGNVTMTNGTYTASTGNTLVMNGTSKTLTTSGNALYNFSQTGGTVAMSGTTTLNGSFALSSGTLTAPTSLNVAGNWTNSGGTFSEGTGTVTLNGATSVNLNSGCANVSTCTNENFYNLIINKTDAADANDNVTLSSNGIRLTNTLTLTDGELLQGTLNVRVEGATAVSIASAGKWNNISTGDLTLGGTFTNAGTAIFASSNSAQCSDVADDITITSTDTNTRLWTNSGTLNLYNVNATYQTNSSITAYTSTLGTGTTWTAGSCGITISGTIYQSSNESNAFDCTSSSGGQLDLVIAVNGDTSPDTGACTSAGGTFSMTATDPGAADIPIALYIANTESEQATTVTLSAAGATNITGVTIILNRLVVTQQSATAMTNSYLNTADNGNSGIRYNVSAGALTVDSGLELHVLASKTFTPGGTVTTNATGGDFHVAGTSTLGVATNTIGRDIIVENGGNLTIGANTTVEGGDIVTVGTGTIGRTGSPIVLVHGTGTIGGGSGGISFYDLTIGDGTTATSTLSSSASVSHTLTVGTSSQISIDTAKVLTLSATSGTSLTLNGTIAGAGTLGYSNTGTTFPTGGTVNSRVQFNTGISGTITIPARTYGSDVDCFDIAPGNCAFGSGTVTIGGNLRAVDTGDGVTLDGSAANPTVSLTGSLSGVDAGTGVQINLGSGTWTIGGHVDLSNVTTLNHNGGSVVMNGTGTLTSNSKTLNNFSTSGSGTITLANATHTLAGNLNLGSSATLAAGSSTVVMNGSSKTIDGGGKTLNNLTISGSTTTLQNTDLTVSSTLTISASQTLSLSSGRTLTHTGATLTWGNGSSTISGAGTLRFTDASGGPGSSGTLNSGVQYDASSGDVASSTFDARTYGGAVEVYSNAGTGHSVSTVGAGTYAFSSSLSITTAGAGATTLDMNTTDPTTFTVSGALTNGTSSVLQATSSGTFNVNGNYTNNGTFTDNSGTVTLAGSSQQTLSGTMSGASDFNHLTVTNTSGSDPDSSPSVIVASGFTTAGTFTAVTPGTKFRFATGATFAPTAINFAGSSGNLVYFRSATPGTAVTFNAGAGSRTVTYTSVRDNNACGSTTGGIDGSDGTNEDGGNTPCWNIHTISLSISDTTVSFGVCSASSARYATGTTGAGTDAADAHTISIGTNAVGGYSLTVAGSTLTASAGTISAIGGSATASSVGNEQFGLRAIKNSGTGTVASPFDTANWAFSAGTTQPVATYGGASASYSAVYGLRYICNVSGTTEAGEYSTDLTYILTSTF